MVLIDGKSEAASTSTFSPLYPAAASAAFSLSGCESPCIVSIPTVLASGLPGVNSPTPSRISDGSPPATAAM